MLVLYIQVAGILLMFSQILELVWSDFTCLEMQPLIFVPFKSAEILGMK